MYSTGERSISSSKRPQTDISEKRRNKTAYSDLSEEQVPVLPSWNDVMFSYKPRRYKSKPESKLDVAGLMVIEAINYQFATAVDYRSYHLVKKSFRYDDNVAHEPCRTAKKIAVEMEGRPFRKRPDVCSRLLI